MLNDIFVYDTDYDTVHRVGDDKHDSLNVVNGIVEYENLQNGCGTLSGGRGTYVFINSENGSLCDSCLYNTRQPECGGCDGQSHFKLNKSTIKSER